MGTEVVIRFRTDRGADRLPLTALASLLRGLPTPFKGFKIFGDNSLLPIHQTDDTLGVTELLAAAEKWNSPEYVIETRTIVNCYRREPDGSSSIAPVRVWIKCLGGGCLGRTGSWLLEGDAEISVGSAVPYVFPVDADGTVLLQDYIKHNVDDLLALLRTAIETLRPIGVKVYTDAGEFYPFNAHFAYFATPEGVLEDISLMRSLFTEGHSVLQFPPLADLHGDEADLVFHFWRDKIRQNRLRDDLGGKLIQEPHATTDDVIATVALATRWDVKTTGFFISGSPYPLNSFLDTFYMAILGEDA